MMGIHLRPIATLALVAVLALPLAARTRAGDKLFKQGQDAEALKNWDAAVDFYKQAFDEDPRDTGYEIAMRRAMFNSGEEHVKMGRDYRAEGNLTGAIAEFQRAIQIDPSSPIAVQELEQTQSMLANPPDNPDLATLTPAQRELRAGEEKIESMLNVPVLNPPVKRIPALTMNNQPVRILYDTVAKIAGVTVVWDNSWNPPDDPYDIDLPESSVEQAFNYLAMVTRTYWKPLTATTIFVTEESANKRRDFEPNIVKTLFVTNATTVQEFQEITTAIRTITDIRRVYAYNALKAMVVRGPAEAVDLAEKLIRDLDKPKSEVAIDVIVMEASTARTRDLAATITGNAGGPGINQNVAFSPRSSISSSSSSGSGTNTSTTTTVSLPNLSSINGSDFSTSTFPGALLKAVMSDATTKILNSPRVRASDGQQVTLNIGDRVPIATGSFQSAAGGLGGVNTQFQYIDVGVNVDITPQVHSSNEVTLQVTIEISNVRSTVTVGQYSQPIVAQKQTTANLRLKDGEVNLLSGLTQNQTTESLAGIPGLIKIPLLGKWLFGSQNTTNDHDELMIAMIPHIIRTPNFTRENLRGVYAGTDQQLMLRFSPRYEDEEPAVATDLENEEENPEVGAVPPQGSVPAPQPQEAEQGAAAPEPEAAPETTQPQAAPAAVGGPPATAPPENGGPARLTFNPGVVMVAPNSPFTVNVQMEDANNLYSVMPLRISWDPALLRLNDIAPGELLSRDGGRVTSVKDIRNDTGQATLSVTRPPGQPGVSGSGAVATLNFVAVAPGSGTITVTELSATDATGEEMPVTLGAVPVAVQ